MFKLNAVTVQINFSRADMRHVMGSTEQVGDFDPKCAPNGEACPSPNGPVDGCCGTCKTGASGVKACYPS